MNDGAPTKDNKPPWIRDPTLRGGGRWQAAIRLMVVAGAATSTIGLAGCSDAQPPPEGPPKVVFVTSTLHTGNLGGPGNADAICRDLASNATPPLSGTFKAWLSTSTISAGARVSHFAGPYALVSGVQIAANWWDLTSGTLLYPIDETESGGEPPMGTAAARCGSHGALFWASTNADGSASDANFYFCGEWTNETSMKWGNLGEAGTRYFWSDSCSVVPCDSTAALLCVEQ